MLLIYGRKRSPYRFDETQIDVFFVEFIYLLVSEPKK